MTNKNMSGGGALPKEEDGSFDNARLLNYLPDMYHNINSSLDAHDVLLSLRARLNEAQIVLEEARTSLHLSQ